MNVETRERGSARTEMREITFREALKEALAEEFVRNPDLFVMGEDLLPQGGVFGVHAGLEADYSDRFMQTPISEAAIVGTAVGVALNGGAVVAEIMFSDFITCCMDEIVNQAAKMRYMSGGQANVPLTIRAPCGMGLGVGAQHTQCVEAWFAHVPGLKVVVPSTPADAKGLLKTAIRGQDPVVFLEYKKLYPIKGPVSSDPDLLVPFGSARTHRAGTDLTIVATGHMVLKALDAAERLSQEGVSAEVIDPRTVAPLDMDTILQSVEKTSRLVVCDESTMTCSVASEIAATVSDQGFFFLDAPVKRVCSPSVPKPFSPALEPLSIPQVEDILAAAREVL
jgi:pyruvate/2-oxoglutarate/acetoin dehydrogenase E1 component